MFPLCERAVFQVSPLLQKPDKIENDLFYRVTDLSGPVHCTNATMATFYFEVFAQFNPHNFNLGANCALFIYFLFIFAFF